MFAYIVSLFLQYNYDTEFIEAYALKTVCLQCYSYRHILNTIVYTGMINLGTA